MGPGRRRADSALGEVQAILNRVADSANAVDFFSSLDRISTFNNGLRELRHLLVDSSSSRKAKDAFRHANGFESLLRVTRTVSDAFTENSSYGDLRVEQLETLKCSLMSISEALSEHARNRQYCVDLDGWTILEESLTSLTFNDPIYSEEHAVDAVCELQQLFGLLYAVALCDDSWISMFRSSLDDTASPSEAIQSPSNINLPQDSAQDDKTASEENLRSSNHIFGSTDYVCNPEMVPIIFKCSLQVRQYIEELRSNTHLKQSMEPNPSEERDQQVPRLLKSLFVRVVQSLASLAKANKYNAVAIHNSDLAAAAFKVALSSNTGHFDHPVLTELSLELVKLGVSNLEDAEVYFQAAEDNESTSRTLLAAIRESRLPPHLVFDLAMHGYSSVEFAQLKNPFPPTPPSKGYSLTAWLRVAEFDESCHTTIFGAFDASQTCFILLYLESGSHQLVLQTSISSKTPSIRFKSVTFREKRWYHVSIVHYTSRNAWPSRVSIYVDGEFREQKRCQYPDSPWVQADNSDPQKPPEIRYIPAPVQCFFGTPQDLSPRLGKNVLSSRWELASAYLFNDVLSDDIILVYSQMSPSYRGNFQDCLGSFQTYKASAILNLRNEERHASDENESAISIAVRSKASNLNPEGNVSLNVSPHTVMGMDKPDIYSSWSTKSKVMLENHFNSLSTRLLINAAVPVLARAVSSPIGVGSIMGGVISYRPLSIEDSCWRLSGCVPTSLRLVAQASTPTTLIIASEILLELIRKSWRNSEAMERCGGFGVLAWALRNKLSVDPSTTSTIVKPVDLVATTNGSAVTVPEMVLRTILEFVGFDRREPENSIINNPLAYRQIILDSGVWEKSDQGTQKLYFEQFVTFATRSRYRAFNAKRLNRMRIVKKFVDAMKSGTISQGSAPKMFEALKAVLECSVTAEIFRSLALYITYAIFSNDSLHLRHGLKRSIERDPARTLTDAEQGIKTLELLAELICDNRDNARTQKFARTVTSKWLLHLLAQHDPRGIIPAIRILVQVLLTGGTKYLAKFEDKQGFIILRRRLERWWHVPDVWSCCWALLFGPNYEGVDFRDPTAAATLALSLPQHDMEEFYCPSVVQVFLAMTENYLMRNLAEERTTDEVANRLRSESKSKYSKEVMQMDTETGSIFVTAAIDALIGMHRFKAFQVLSTSRHFTRDVLAVLYKVSKEHAEDERSLSESIKVDESELDADNGSKTAKSDALQRLDSARSISPASSQENVQGIKSSTQSRLRARRNSSFVMVNAKNAGSHSLMSFLKPLGPSADFVDHAAFNHPVFCQLIKLLASIYVDEVIHQPDYSGLGLYLKSPSATAEKRSSINSLVLRETIAKVTEKIAEKTDLLHDPKVLTNLARFGQQTYEALLEGWLIYGGPPMLEFLAAVLGYLRRPDVRILKSIRLCSQTVSLLQGLLWRLSLHQLLISEDGTQFDPQVDSSGKTLYPSTYKKDESEEKLLLDLVTWSELLFGASDSDDPSVSSPRSDTVLLQAFCYILCQKIIHGSEPVRAASMLLYRSVLSQSLRELSTAVTDENLEKTWLDFARVVTSDSESISAWLSSNGRKLERVLDGSLKSSVIQFVQRENALCQSTGSSRALKRKERLQQWNISELEDQRIWAEHDLSTAPWAENICESELYKHLRIRQDQQDAQEYFEALYRRYDAVSLRQRLPMINDSSVKWSLDETEGRSRMRMRLLPSKDAQDLQYKPKRRQTIARERETRPEDAIDKPKGSRASSKSVSGTYNQGQITPAENTERIVPVKGGIDEMTDPPTAEDFEIVQDVEDDTEDKNRRVMRSLQRGEQVHFVYNVSRIRGLEACESLLIIGEKSLYLLSHLFQRSDGEIVNEWQAPASERDPYTQMITGREIKRSKGNAVHDIEAGTRHWSWAQIISVSKRRFLSRPVALEIFFQDGRSYLLTAMSEQERNKLYANLLDRAVKLRSSSGPDEDAWRVELLPDPHEPPHTMGSRLVSAFSLGNSLPATSRWIKGEISNFQYLMMVNTMAGRTFNDLTQYPVFPWVIADYSSENLDLENPRTFRDLTKPMGCQSPAREAAFRERFQAFAEMNENKTPAFHYGTHYSTAMIVTSYLIRLQPFVDAYLLLQGGTFDHADRLFYSIEKAWLSASQENMTDVRELTPEFFYLPDFLVNLNSYEFGSREASGERINDVKLPPWAKGDPELFIAKNREALESPYVSQNLHSWIDLIFGNKQRGEAAADSTNVFHHLSYQDATDLERLGDGMERLATIGIIHNFGQTPAQIFGRPHDRRESMGSKTRRLHQLIESLHRLPAPIYRHYSQICQLDYALKQQRLLCCGPFRAFAPSKYNIVMEWGHADGSIRFYHSDSKKRLGIFEQPHQDEITCALFVDSTLVTASRDCTVAVWNVNVNPDAVDMQLQGSLFGHRLSVSVLRVSRPLSTIVSIDISGRVLLWDLNSLDLVREIPNTRRVQSAQINNSNGHIILCCDQRVVMYSLNGRLLLDQMVCSLTNDRIHCCSFYESSGSEWLSAELIFTGHRWGVVNVWKLATDPDGAWRLDLVRRLNHVDRSRTDGRNIPFAITALCPLNQNLYTGDDDGNVFEWACSR